MKTELRLIESPAKGLAGEAPRREVATARRRSEVFALVYRQMRALAGRTRDLDDLVQMAAEQVFRSLPRFEIAQPLQLGRIASAIARYRSSGAGTGVGCDGFRTPATVTSPMKSTFRICSVLSCSSSANARDACAKPWSKFLLSVVWWSYCMI